MQVIWTTQVLRSVSLSLILLFVVSLLKCLDVCTANGEEKKLTRFSHLGTLFFLSPLKYKLITITDKNVDSVMRIMLRQKYAPKRKKKHWYYTSYTLTIMVNVITTFAEYRRLVLYGTR